MVVRQLQREQAGFRRGRSTVDQVTLLAQDIEDNFQANEKAGVVLLDLTAAFNTVWHRKLRLKLLRTIPDRIWCSPELFPFPDAVQYLDLRPSRDIKIKEVWVH